MKSLKLLKKPEIRKEAFRVRREAEQKVSANPAVFVRQLVKDVRRLLNEAGDEILMNGHVWGRFHPSAGDSKNVAVRGKFNRTGADSVCEVCLGGAYFMEGLGLDQTTLPMNSLMEIANELHEGGIPAKKKREKGITRTAQRLAELTDIACSIDGLRSGNIYSYLESHLEFCWSRKKQGGVFWVLPAHPDNKEKPIKRIPLEASKGVPFFESKRELVPIGLSRLEELADFLDENLRRRKIRHRAELKNYADRYAAWQSTFSEVWTGWET